MRPLLELPMAIADEPLPSWPSVPGAGPPHPPPAFAAAQVPVPADSPPPASPRDGAPWDDDEIDPFWVEARWLDDLVPDDEPLPEASDFWIEPDPADP
jgi:hypothetical protein